MIWTIVIGAIIYGIYRFANGIRKDVHDLHEKPVSDKFFIIVNNINEVAFDGNGVVTPINYSEFNLYKEGSNQIIQFSYSLGGLVITWIYKYAQREVVHTEIFVNVRNISLSEQEMMANKFIRDAQAVIRDHRHQIDLLSAQLDRETIGKEPEDYTQRQAIKMVEYLETQWKLTAQELLENAIEKAKAEEYEGALEDVKRGLRKAEEDKVPIFHQIEAFCYLHGGDYENALTAIDMAISTAKLFLSEEVTFLSKLNDMRLEILSNMDSDDKPW
jgi:hypothetical protein